MTQTVSQVIATQLANASIKRGYGLSGGENVPTLAALKAFIGQLVPLDPNDEPASELLARIRQQVG